MPSFLDILPELHWRIFQYCHVRDLINLACSCSQWNSALKTHLWSTVTVPTAFLLKRKISLLPGNKKWLRNLKWTQKLHFSNKGACVNKEKSLKRWEQECTKILKCCDPYVLKDVYIEGIFVNDSTIRILSEICTNLTKLTFVGISDFTRITFGVLENITLLKLLSELTLDSCGIGDSDILCISRRLPRLHSLDIRHTFVTDDGLFHLLNFKLLRKLVLNQCRYVTDKGMSYISALPCLTKLYLFNCRMGDNALRSFSTLQSLRSVDIASTCVTDHGLIFVSKLRFIQHLDISACHQLTDQGMCYVAKLFTLTKLHVYQCNVSDKGLSYICQLSALRCLDIGSTNITDIGLVYLGKLVLLEELDISSNPESNSFITDVGVTRVLAMKSLRKLDMGWLNVGDDSLAVIQNSPSLTELSVIGCSNLTDTAMKYVARVKTLKKIDITSTNITDIGLDYLSRADSLQKISCGFSNVTEVGMQRIDSHIVLIRNFPS